MAYRLGKVVTKKSHFWSIWFCFLNAPKNISVIVFVYFAVGQITDHNGAGLKNQLAHTTQEMIPSHAYTGPDQHENPNHVLMSCSRSIIKTDLLNIVSCSMSPFGRCLAMFEVGFFICSIHNAFTIPIDCNLSVTNFHYRPGAHMQRKINGNHSSWQDTQTPSPTPKSHHPVSSGPIHTGKWGADNIPSQQSQWLRRAKLWLHPRVNKQSAQWDYCPLHACTVQFLMPAENPITILASLYTHRHLTGVVSTFL